MFVCVVVKKLERLQKMSAMCMHACVCVSVKKLERAQDKC